MMKIMWVLSTHRNQPRVSNFLGQYASSPVHRAYCYAELAIFYPSSGHSHHWYSL